MSVFQWVKVHLLKVALTIAVTVLIVQYWRYSEAESHRFEPLRIDFARVRMRISQSDNVTAFDEADELNASSSDNASAPAAPDAYPPDVYPPDTPSKPPNETLCPPVPPNLNGPIDISLTYKELYLMEKDFQDLEPGGMFRPKTCKARNVVALVIPYRDRIFQLSIFLNNMHRLLMKQQIDYAIFVVEQSGDFAFNRGKLMNVGFVEASKVKRFDCFIFHDVDLIPENDMNLYTCPEQPRHMSVAVSKFKYKLPYNELFGGVCALRKEHFQLVNGFSNMFWGWGAEDDNMYNRLRKKGLYVSRYPPNIARYTMLRHDNQKPNPKRYEILQKSQKLYGSDGLSDLDYEVKALEFKRLFTWILVDLRPPR